MALHQSHNMHIYHKSSPTSGKRNEASSKENNSSFSRLSHGASIGAATAVGEKARLGTKQR